MTKRFFLSLTSLLMYGPLFCQDSRPNDSAWGITLLNAFVQARNRNNCSSIAFIKSAIGTFGLHGVFTTQTISDVAFTVQFRNGDTVTLRREELIFCTSQNGFTQIKGDDSSHRIKLLADTYFALICKKQQLLDGSSFKAAINKMNTGYRITDIAPLLGLRFKCINTSNTKKLSAHNHIIVYNFYHAAYATYGLYDEAFYERRPKKLKQFKWNHKGPDDIYIPYLCDIRAGLEIENQ